MSLVDPERVYTIWLLDKWRLCEHRFASMRMRRHLSVLFVSMFVVASVSATYVILAVQTFQFFKFGHSRLKTCYSGGCTFVWNTLRRLCALAMLSSVERSYQSVSLHISLHRTFGWLTRHFAEKISKHSALKKNRNPSDNRTTNMTRYVTVCTYS
jgi:hypothetical protein